MHTPVKEEWVAVNPEHVLKRIHLFHNCAELDPTVECTATKALVCGEHAMRLELMLVLHRNLKVSFVGVRLIARVTVPYLAPTR